MKYLTYSCSCLYMFKEGVPKRVESKVIRQHINRVSRLIFFEIKRISMKDKVHKNQDKLANFATIHLLVTFLLRLI